MDYHYSFFCMPPQLAGAFAGLSGPLNIPGRDFGGISLNEYVDIQLGAMGVI
jgi:hypothetical protein